MKEIEFIPQWYRDIRRKQRWYRMQYIVLLCLAALLAGWSFFSARSLSKAQAGLQKQQLSPAQKQMLDECAAIQTKLVDMSRQAGILKKIDSKITVADLLAEISFLVDSRLIMTQIDIQAESLDESGQNSSDGSLRVARSASGGRNLPLTGDIRFKVAMQGLACDASDAAGFIRKLETSPYFCQVLPDFSRTSKIKEKAVSEFGINAYLANYKEAK